MKIHQLCYECVLNGKCLLQDNDDVEECQDIIEYENQDKL